MNKHIFFISAAIFLASCASTNVQETAEKVPSGEEKLVQQADIRQAVEMHRFLVKFDRMYISNGGRIDLIPKSNYIILDGDRVVISAAYAGRQFSSRPIRGIDMVGKAVSFELKDKVSRGLYEIKMKVANDLNTFDVYLTVSNEGYCNASLNNYKIDHVRYTGNFIPLRAKPEEQEQQQQQDTGDDSLEISI